MVNEPNTENLRQNQQRNQRLKIGVNIFSATLPVKSALSGFKGSDLLLFCSNNLLCVGGRGQIEPTSQRMRV